MKILKILGITLLLIALIFFGRGLLTSSIDYDCEVTVDSTAQKAWEIMSDESNLAKWIDGYKRTELVSGTANTVGAVSNVYIDEQGKEMVMTETIKAVRPNEHLAMDFSMDFMDMGYEINFSEEGGKTKISSSSSTQGNGLFAKSMISFMAGAMKEQEQTNLNKLKALIEGN